MPFDATYLIVLPAFLFAAWAGAHVKSVFSKYSSHTTQSGMTAAEAARMMLDRNGLSRVPIRTVSGSLTDHYDPQTDTVFLSDSVYSSRSTAAIGVACHEVGHAIQHAEQYAPATLRQKIVPLTNFGSKVGIWLFLIGILLACLSERLLAVSYIGLLLFSLTAVFQLVTLPTEFNASRRALNGLASFGFTAAEQNEVKKVLTAAALTYVAALATAVSQVLRLLVLLGRRKR